ncbi:hypothetical protein EON73_03315, partial [bacterium]
KDPLPGMIRRTKAAIKPTAFENGMILLPRSLHVSNPSIPRLYTQLKLHKPGRKVRPITPNINSPTEKLAKWLLRYFNSLPIKFETASIKNSIDFVREAREVTIENDELIVSFDAESLYTNIPMDETMICLRDLLTMNHVIEEEVNELVGLTELCMKESYFQCNGKYYRQKFGCSMGSALSPFLANLFMSHFETTLKNGGNFPRVWFRYVDDVFSIIKKHKLRQFLHRLNHTQYKTIKFTYEEEVNDQLNFLDVTVIRNNGKLEFDIYRKPTNTMRYITSDSYHSFEQKIAAFHSMIFRALNIPLNEERLRREILKIKEIASINGYTEQLIDDLVIAHKRKKELRNHTTLSLINENSMEEMGWTKFAYQAELNKKLKLMKCVNNNYELDALESFYINKFKNENLLNENNGPIANSIFEKFYD